MKNNEIKYRVVYDKYKYLCANRRLTLDIDKARVFSSAAAARDFARFDIDNCLADVYAYVPCSVRRLVKFWEVSK